MSSRRIDIADLPKSGIPIQLGLEFRLIIPSSVRSALGIKEREQFLCSLMLDEDTNQYALIYRPLSQVFRANAGSKQEAAQ